MDLEFRWLILVMQVTEFLFFMITIPVYIIVLIILFKGFLRKDIQLSQPFFGCCFIVGVADIVALITNNFGSVIPKTCMFRSFYLENEYVILKPYFVLVWITSMCQCISVTVIAFNRFCILVENRFVAKLWKRPYVCIFYGIQIVPSVLWGFNTLFFPQSYAPRYECQLLPKINDEVKIRMYMKVAGAGLVLSTVLSLTMYLIMFYKIKRENARQDRRPKNKPKTKKTRFKIRTDREYRLLTVAVCICTTQAIFAIYVVLREIFMYDRGMFGFNLINDIYSGINPYLLLGFSKHVRNSFPWVPASFSNTTRTLPTSVALQRARINSSKF